jgi:pimeloyl-ACP methyl ester carboxylesterase
VRMGSPADWSREFVEAAGLRLRVGRRGTGRPLLLIIGIGAHLDMWAPFARHAGERELIAFEHPARDCRSDRACPCGWPLWPTSSARCWTSCGWSASTCSATPGAARSPRSSHGARQTGSAGLVLCATGPGLGGSPPRPLALLLATPARYYHPRLLVLTVPHIAGARTARDPAVLAEHAGERLQRPPDPLGYVYQLYASAGLSRLPWLGRLPQPTLVVAGERAASVPVRNARLLADRVPHARLPWSRTAGTCSCSTSPRTSPPRFGSSWTSCHRLTTNGRKLHSRNQVHSPAPGEIVSGT